MSLVFYLVLYKEEKGSRMGIVMSESERQRERDTMSSHRLFNVGIDRSRLSEREERMAYDGQQTICPLQTKLEKLMPTYLSLSPWLFTYCTCLCTD